MTERRLDRLEGGLPPKEATLLWLEEAHRFGSLVAYCGWLVDRPLAEAPLVRIPEQAKAAVRRAMAGEPKEHIWEAEHQVERDVAFLFEVVVRLNAAAEETVRLGGLRYGLLWWQQRALSHEAAYEDDGLPETSGRMAERLTGWREAVSTLLLDLYIEAEARRIVEARFLDGHPVLFPDTVERWDRLREAVEDLAGLAEALSRLGPERSGLGPVVTTRIDLDALRAVAHLHAAGEAERLTDIIRAEALDIMGDTAGAAAMIAPHLRETRPVTS